MKWKRCLPHPDIVMGMFSELQFSSFVWAYMYLKIFVLYVTKSKIIHKN